MAKTKIKEHPLPPSGLPVTPQYGPEIVIGIVGPVGTDLDMVIDTLCDQLKIFQYRPEIIRISKLLHDVPEYAKKLAHKAGETEFHRIKNHMSAGTSFRKKSGRADILALMALKEIRNRRLQSNKKRVASGSKNNSNLVSTPAQRTAYILRSLKHPDEVTSLRSIYGGGFILISIYSPKDSRADALSELIASSVTAKATTKNHSFDKAHELIQIDEQEDNTSDLGQNVSDAFPLADVFIDGRSKDNVQISLKRFFEAYFEYPYHSPDKDEYAMFNAVSASIRSADLSRQVGAVITNNEGDIIAQGCNDIPKSGGGLYWCDDKIDKRDFKLGQDKNVAYKHKIINEIIEA